MASLLALALLRVLAAVLDPKARREEVWLRARYPLSDYAARTKRFVPGLLLRCGALGVLARSRWAAVIEAHSARPPRRTPLDSASST